MQTTKKTVGLESKSFTYDAVFDHQSTQDQVYNHVSPVVKSFLTGYNGTIIAYGQTGSGKTYTMGTSASPENDGVIPKACTEVFQTLKDRANVKTCEIQATFVEIYNESIQDLLNKAAPIDHMKFARKRTVRSPEEVMNYLEMGSHSRATGSTKMNKDSSRSHAIFTLWLTQKPKEKTGGEANDEEKVDEGDEILASKFHFVDLAGSERIKKTGAEGAQLKEGIQINKGLFALSQVITALAAKKSHVPFRDSKITKLLEDSLGGNARTVLVACISPASDNCEESMQTLRYASQVRYIKNKPTLNFSINDAKVKRYRLRIQELEEKNAELQEFKIKYFKAQSELRVYQEMMGAATPRSDLSPDPSPRAGDASSSGGSAAHSKSSSLEICIEGPTPPIDVAKDTVAPSVVPKLALGSIKAEADTSAATAEVATRKQEMETHKMEIDKLSTEMAHDEENHTQFVSTSKVKMCRLTELLIKKQTEIDRLSEELREVAVQKEAVDAQLLEYQKQVVEKEREFRRLEKTGKNPRQAAKLTQLSHQIRGLKKKLKHEEHKRTELVRTERRLDKLKREVNSVKKDKIRLKREITEREARHRIAVKKKESKLMHLAKEKRRALLRMRKLQQKLSKQQSVSKQKDTQINILKERVKRMQPRPDRYSSRSGRQTRQRSRKRGAASEHPSHSKTRSPKYRRSKNRNSTSSGHDENAGGSNGATFKFTDAGRFLDSKKRVPMTPLNHHRASLQPQSARAASCTGRRMSVYEHADRIGRQNRKLHELQKKTSGLDKENAKLKQELHDFRARASKLVKLKEDLRQELIATKKRIQSQDQLLFERESQLIEVRKEADRLRGVSAAPATPVA